MRPDANSFAKKSLDVKDQARRIDLEVDGNTRDRCLIDLTVKGAIAAFLGWNILSTILGWFPIRGETTKPYNGRLMSGI